MTVRLAPQEETLPGGNLMEQFQFALDCGFGGIELSGKGAACSGCGPPSCGRHKRPGW